MIKIRNAVLEDIPKLRQLFKDTVLYINCKDYSEDEIKDWMSCGDDIEHLEDLILNLYFIVAESLDGLILGFSSIAKEGYLHSMFIHKDYQRKGIASLLYDNIEMFALNNGINTITSEVSITARGFFERKNFIVKKEQRRKAKNLFLQNYIMIKNL